MGDLEELEMIETPLLGLESSSNRFHLPPDIDQGFRLA
jgi:hypothetical protein